MNKRDSKLKELLKDSELSDFDYEGFDSADELIGSLETQINETEVIYYSNAMKYLSENDASLKYSIAIASDLGYETKSINSELLATLLQQQNLHNELHKYRAEIEDIFNEEEE